jgi:eukaryotic-like serine/threonine-protein kinase
LRVALNGFLRRYLYTPEVQCVRGARSVPSNKSGITQLLSSWREGDRDAEKDLMEHLYPVLRGLVGAQLRRAPSGLTLSATELANEAYIRLEQQREVDWKNREHFFAITATVVRRVVIDYLRERSAEKRGAGQVGLQFDELHSGDMPSVGDQIDWLALDQALIRTAREWSNCACSADLGWSASPTYVAAPLRPSVVNGGLPAIGWPSNSMSRYMTVSNRLGRLQALFAEALEIPEARRKEWLDDLANEPPGLIDELRRLIARDERSDSIPDGMPVDLLASALAVSNGERPCVHASAGNFVLYEELGRGGMGCVFRGVRESGGVHQEAAIKILRAELRHSAAIERFLAERRTLARLEHPGIARLLDVGETDDGTPFVAMELIRGRTLLDYCAEKSLGISARVAVFRQVVAAVIHAHRALVVHRDIKPSNVMVDSEGRARLLDFGIAKGLVDDVKATATVDRYFTPAYAAPEQLTGEPITVACDVYALGALLHELLCGVPPFQVAGLRAADIERLILATPPPPMEQAFASQQLKDGQPLSADVRNLWRKTLRGDLECIVQRALRKEPQARYVSAEALDEDLQNWLEHRPVRASGGHGLYRVRKFIRRNVIATIAAAIVLASMTIAAALIVRQGVIASRERDRAREALAALSDAFVAADPTGLSGGEVSARSILDAAGRRISRHVASQPEIYAELAAEVGGVQLALGVIDADDRSMTQALEWAKSEPDQEALARRLSLLQARRLVAQHAFAESDQALQVLERERGKDAYVLLTRGKYWMAKSEPGRAIPILMDAADRLPKDMLDIDRIDAQWQLAEAQRLGGHAVQALATLESLLGPLNAVLDANHATVLLTRLRKVDVLLDLGRIEEAIDEAQTLSISIENAYGRKSSVTALTWSTLALALVRAERYSDSIGPYRNAAMSYAESLGANHVTTARSYFNLALMQTYIDPGDSKSAENFVKAIAAATVARDPTDPLVTFFRIEYAKSLIARGAMSAAQEVLLPENVTPDLDAAGADIATVYREQLTRLFGSLECPPSRRLGPARSRADRARVLICRARESNVDSF